MEEFTSYSQEFEKAVKGEDNEKAASVALDIVENLRDQLSKLAITKRLIVRHYAGKGDALYFVDENGQLINDIESFLRSQTVVFCNGTFADFHTAHSDLFDDRLPISVTRRTQISLRINYVGGGYTFSDEYSFSHWRCPLRNYMQNAHAIIVVPMAF